MVVKKWFNMSLLLSIAILTVASYSVLKILPAQAADVLFSDGITVDSTLDTIDANIGNGVCDDGSGNCTLRAAIQEANSNADTSVIKFNIAEVADFTNGGQSGFTITPTSALPDITQTATIDGYTQPGASANTTVSPAPLDTVILIEINGVSAGSPGVNGLTVRANNTIIQGLSVNRFSQDGIIVAADNVKVWGNYLGTDPTGLIERGNGGSGLAQSDGDNDNLEFGGLTPSKRNIASGNDNTGISPNGGSDSWVIQGNYFGLAATGVSAIPNATISGAGALSIDQSSGTLIGGSAVGAANVISGNFSFGIAPLQADNLVVEGNLIGTDYTGTTALSNGSSGISFNNSNNVHIVNNIIGNNGWDGIYIGESEDALVVGNTIGSGSIGNESFGNGYSGIFIDNSQRAMIGGTDPSESNTIINSTYQGVSVVGASQGVAIIGNSIHNNSAFGIDLSQNGLTANDVLDIDTGPNNLLNFPDNLQYDVNGGNTDMTYTLDVPAGQYRVEFFSNTTADGSGYGEGQTYLASHDVTKTGSGSQSFARTLTGASLPNISATATLKDGSADGFGPTSEFSATATQRPPVTDISLEKTILNPGGVSAGGAIDYQLTITNNGSDDLDLTQFDNPLGTAIISDFLDPDLTPINLGSPEPSLPGSFYLSDVGNPDLTCLWGGPGSGALVGLTTYGDYSFVSCIFTGAGDTTLEAGQSLSMVLNVNIAGDSDMVFTNYAFATPSTLGDPDNAAIGSIFGVGEDYLALFIANQSSNSPINNFASVAYPLPVEPGVSVTTSPPSPLAAAGTNETTWILTSLGMLAVAAWLAIRLRKSALIPR